MTNYILFDTETTGITKHDRVIQVGAMIIDSKNNTKVFDELCSVDIDIPIDAMMVHGITPDKLIGKPKFIDTKFYKDLNNLNTSENYLIAHNIKFDIDMIKKEGFENKLKLIDTFRCARHLLPDENRHKLQYLRYSLKLYENEAQETIKHNINIKAHDAIGDVIVMKLLLSNLVSIVRSKFVGQNPMDKLVHLTSTPATIQKINFGKHSGKTLKDINTIDRSYLRWLLENTDDEDMIHSIKALNITQNDKKESKSYNNQHKRVYNKPANQATNNPKLIKIMPFGKFKGEKLEDICEKNMEYIDWLLENTDNENFKKELEYSVDKLINEV